MPDLIDEVSKLKNLARIQRKRGRHDKAVLTLQRAMDRLKPELDKTRAAAGLDDPAKVAAGRVDPADDWEIRIAAELADFYGILGGTLREQENYVDAAAAYDAGYTFESSKRYGFVNSYNALNRLTVRILLRKESLTEAEAFEPLSDSEAPYSLLDPDTLHSLLDAEAPEQEKKVEFVDVPDELDTLRKEIARQVAGVRSGDLWAAGDLWFVSLLVGDAEKATDAWQHFLSLSPPSYAYSTYLKVIEEIAKLDTPRKPLLDGATKLLKEKLGLSDDG